MEYGEVLSTIVRDRGFPSDVVHTAEQLLHEWRQKNNNVSELSYAVCALYAASIMHRNSNESESGTTATHSISPTLSDILHAANVHIKSFFDWMGRLQTDQTLHPSIKPSLKATMQKYCVTSALYHKFQQMLNWIFVHDEDRPSTIQTEGSKVIEGHPNRKHICWILFLLAKGSLGQASNELVVPLHLLICCMDYITKLSPSFLLQEPFYSAHYTQLTDDAILDVLCQEMGCLDDISDVRSVRDSCLVHILRAIPQEMLNQGLECLPELDYLQQQYQLLYMMTGDIDEQLFLDSTSHLYVEKPPSACPSDSKPGTQPQSPVMTPVKRAITSVQSLKSLLCTASDTPSSSLTIYFKNCSSDPSCSIKQRISSLKEKYIHHFKRLMGSTWSAAALSRFQTAVRLYYRVLEAMLKREEERLSTNNFSSLLLSDLFHKSLLACALEVVNVTYEYSPHEFPAVPDNASRFLFPWILDVFSLKAYEFGKVLESFMKDEPSLSQDARKHLQRIETRIVESMAWQSSSPLYDLIGATDTTAQMTTNSTIGNSIISTTGLTAADMYLSPIRPVPHAPKPNQTTSQHSSPSHKPVSQSSNISVSPRRTRSVSLNMFLNKVLQLAYSRLHRLSEMLGVSKDLEKFMWTCVEHSIRNKPELMKNRHLDQIIMSCIYAISKLTDSELKFKEIVNAYRSLPHAEATTYRNVAIDGAVEDSIIMFYNKVFMPAMKGYILQFQPRNQQTPALSPSPSRTSTLSHVSPGVKIGPNLYISPLKESPFKSPHPVRHSAFASPSQQTPSKRTQYSFGEGPESSEKLREINAWMKRASTNSPNNRSTTSKRLRFGDEDATGSSPSQDDANRHDTNGTSSSNGVSSTNGHVTSMSTDEPINMQPLPPSMQHRVAMMKSERQ